MPRRTISCCCMLQLIWAVGLHCTQLAHASGSCVCCRLGTIEQRCYPRSLCVAVSALHAVRCFAVIPPQLDCHDAGSQHIAAVPLQDEVVCYRAQMRSQNLFNKSHSMSHNIITGEARHNPVPMPPAPAPPR
jgi:hypothetical protein